MSPLTPACSLNSVISTTTKQQSSKATKQRSPRRHHTGPNFTQARVDGTPNLLEGKLWRLPPRTYPAPLTCVARFPILFPPLGHARTHTRCSLACLRFCGSFLLFGIVSSPPRLAGQSGAPLGAHVDHHSNSSTSRQARPARRPDALEPLQRLNQRHRDKTFILKKFTLLVD